MNITDWKCNGKMEDFELTDHQGHEGSLSDEKKTVRGSFSSSTYIAKIVNGNLVSSPYDLSIIGKWTGNKEDFDGQYKSLLKEVRCDACDKVWH